MNEINAGQRLMGVMSSGVIRSIRVSGVTPPARATDVPLPLQPKSTRTDEDRARIRELARGSKS